ncbi:MAG TPA: hypothetical protein PLG34_13960 [Spirochaetota bacterium]|nr:hypothetical protein [Spirochaetota bacterium]
MNTLIENQDGTYEEVKPKEENPSIKGDLESVSKIYTAPMKIKTFKAIQVGEDLKNFIIANGFKTGSKTSEEEDIAYMTYDDGVSTQAFVLKDFTLYLVGEVNESNDQYSISNKVEILLNDGDYIARYDGLFNKVNNVIEYTEEIDKLSKLLKNE